jgi:hypothetical protein
MSTAYPMNISATKDMEIHQEFRPCTTQALIAEPGRLDRRDSCGWRIDCALWTSMTFIHLLRLRYDLENMKKIRNKALF